MPTLEQLKICLAKLLPSATEFADTVYRSSTPKYATEDDLLTGEGSNERVDGGTRRVWRLSMLR